MAHEFTDDQRKRSNSVRSDKARAVRVALANEIVKLSRAGTLAKTLGGIAKQLTVKTTRNTAFTRVKLSLALDEMGVNQQSVKRWRARAESAKADYRASRDDLLWQLFDQWLYWVRANGPAARKANPFTPVFADADKYVMLMDTPGVHPPIHPEGQASFMVMVALMGWFDPLDEGGGPAVEYPSRDASGNRIPLSHWVLRK